MLLRRVIAHVRKQEWTAVALDFLIVVAGILLAFQITAWSEVRADRLAEQRFLVQLHTDIERAEATAQVALDRRLERAGQMLEAAGTLLDPTQAPALSETQCQSIMSSSIFAVPIGRLGSFEELVASGRIAIIRDEALRTQLLALREIADAANRMIPVLEGTATGLLVTYPDVIEGDAFFSEDLGEVRLGVRCDVAAMRANRGFLNALSVNVDAQDSFTRSNLAAWRDQLTSLHERIDAILAVSHDSEAP
jgi:hypothetical protein